MLVTRARGCRLMALCVLLAAVGACSQDADLPEADLEQLPPDVQVMELVVRGDLDALEPIFEQYPNLVQLRGDYARTPLHVAAGHDREEVVNFLLARGADPTAVDENGETPADAARQQGFTSLAKKLQAAAESASGDG